jgi:nuclease S1
MTNAQAWGAAGHRLIAELAQTQLTPPAAAEVDRLLSQEPGAPLVSVSTWADEVRRPGTAPMRS